MILIEFFLNSTLTNEIIPSEKNKKHKSNSEKVRELSNHQRELKDKINSLNEKHEKRECIRERTKVMKELHREIEMEECRKIGD